MVRFANIIAVGVTLLAATAVAAPLETSSAVDGWCNPDFCMGMAVLDHQCYTASAAPLAERGAYPAPMTSCVCSNAAAKEEYLTCNGVCNLDRANEPYCSKKAVARNTVVAKKAVQVPPSACNPQFCMGMTALDSTCWTTTPSGFNSESGVLTGPNPLTSCVCADPKYLHDYLTCKGYCNVDITKDIFCNKAITGSATVADEVGTTVHKGPEVTEAVSVKAREANRIKNWTNFCGVPGQACGEKIVMPTPEPGSDFVDVGTTQDESLEGKIGGGSKRAAALSA